MVHASAGSPVSFLKDALKSIFVLGVATSVSFLIVKLSGSYDHLAVIYVLAVVLVSRFTAGYLWGILAAIAGVVVTNYYFTYPYHAFNFTISGYPVTFISMLAVSLVTSAMTAQIKEQRSFLQGGSSDRAGNHKKHLRPPFGFAEFCGRKIRRASGFSGKHKNDDEELLVSSALLAGEISGSGRSGT